MKASNWLITSLAALAIAACDVVEFPGAGQSNDGAVPPPPAGAPATPVDEASPNLETPVATVPETLPTTETPANTENTEDALIAPEEQAPDDTSPSSETTPDTPTGPAPVDLSEFAGITDLQAINAARCAPTTEETMTLAELTGATAASATVTAQAVNGIAVTTAAFPGIVKMEPRRTLESGGISSGHCGATRIAHNWFVTASHCLDDVYDEVQLTATERDLTDPRAKKIKATASLCHAAYGGARGQYANDIALVAISDADADVFQDVPIARFGLTERPLGPTNYPSARMAGWGLTGFDEGLSNTLLTAELSMVTSGPAAVTVASRDGSGPCIGDSGGPLLIDEADGQSKVIGVLSVVEQNRETGEFCKGAYNARYTNLQGYVDWIEDVVGVCTVSPELCAR